MNRLKDLFKKIKEKLQHDKQPPFRTVDEHGTKEWRLSNGKLHREDGPALEDWTGIRKFYIHGKELTAQQFALWQEEQVELRRITHINNKAADIAEMHSGTSTAIKVGKKLDLKKPT